MNPIAILSRALGACVRHPLLALLIGVIVFIALAILGAHVGPDGHLHR